MHVCVHMYQVAYIHHTYMYMFSTLLFLLCSVGEVKVKVVIYVHMYVCTHVPHVQCKMCNCLFFLNYIFYCIN